MGEFITTLIVGIIFVASLVGGVFVVNTIFMRSDNNQKQFWVECMKITDLDQTTEI